MSEVIWTKDTLARAINTRVDQQRLDGDDFIMANEITDDALAAWQEFYDTNKTNPMVIESEYVRFYQAIVAGW